MIGSLFSVQAAIAMTGFILSPVLALLARARRMKIEPLDETAELLAD
jgi:hypothetical protein